MADYNENDVDFVSDLNEGNDTSTTQQQGNQQQGNAPDDIRTLLENAAKVGTEQQEAKPDTRPRDEQGKFVKKDEQAQQANTQQQGNDQQQNTQQQAPANQQSQQAPLIPEYQELVSSLPETERGRVAGVLAARETAWQQYAEQLNSRANGYAGIEQIIAPRRQAFAMQGTTPEAVINQLFALSDFANRDPVEFIQWFAGNNSIDLSELGETYLPPDPQVRQLQQQVQQLQSHIQGFNTQQQSQQQNALVQEVTTFQNAVDQSGQPMYPHFATVANEMLPLVGYLRNQNPQANPQEILRQAYERAVYANPTTRQALMQAEQARMAAEQAANRVQQVARAKTANQSITGNAPANANVSANQIPSDTVRGALEAAFAQHG